MRAAALRAWLRALHLADRLRLRLRVALHPGVEIHPEAGANLAFARFVVAPGGSVRVGRGVVTERRRGLLSFLVEPGGAIEVGEGTWLRTELGPVTLVAFAGGRLEIGPDCMLNGCHLSAKSRVRLGRRVFVGPGVRVFDADQHDLDDARPERVEPVTIDDHAWIASDATVLRGVSIGAHAIVGARSLVTAPVPAHRVAHGVPARLRGEVGDRSRAR